MTRATEKHREQTQSTGIRLFATCVSSLSPSSCSHCLPCTRKPHGAAAALITIFTTSTCLSLSVCVDSFRGEDKRNRKDNISLTSGHLDCCLYLNSSRVTYTRGCWEVVTYRMAHLPHFTRSASSRKKDEREKLFPFYLQSLPSLFLLSLSVHSVCLFTFWSLARCTVSYETRRRVESIVYSMIVKCRSLVIQFTLLWLSPTVTGEQQLFLSLSPPSYGTNKGLSLSYAYELKWTFPGER